MRQALEAVFAQHGRAARVRDHRAAARPTTGLLPQRAEFLRTLARLAAQHGALLIFDEVISGFRVGFQGYAPIAGVTPDLVTYGKIIGGGFPVGAYGGRRELMQLVAPVGPVYQAGTLSANPVAMCAGLATLARAERRHRVRANWKRAARSSNRRCARCPTCSCSGSGSIFWLCLTGRMRLQDGAPLRSPGALPAGLRAALRCDLSSAAGAGHLSCAQRLRSRVHLRRAHQRRHRELGQRDQRGLRGPAGLIRGRLEPGFVTDSTLLLSAADSAMILSHRICEPV